MSCLLCGDLNHPTQNCPLYPPPSKLEYTPPTQNYHGLSAEQQVWSTGYDAQVAYAGNFAADTIADVKLKAFKERWP